MVARQSGLVGRAIWSPAGREWRGFNYNKTLCLRYSPDSRPSFRNRGSEGAARSASQPRQGAARSTSYLHSNSTCD